MACCGEGMVVPRRAYDGRLLRTSHVGLSSSPVATVHELGIAVRLSACFGILAVLVFGGGGSIIAGP